MNLLLNINMVIVSIVQQNLPYKIYMKTSIFLFMNEFAFEYMNIIVSIVQQNLPYKLYKKT